MQKTICDLTADFLSETIDGVGALKEIYAYVKSQWTKESKTLEESIRASIYRDKKYHFKRVAKGVYLLPGKNTASLLIHGDGRKLNEIEDGSVQTIITDHPWADKKAHQSGNQKCFADYDTFKYTIEDFKEKYRVLENGCFLAECLPVESATNWEYITSIKQMAKDCGFEYYAQIIWRKNKEGEINTGRTTKGVENILIFSKGKPRRLAPVGKPYMTRHILSYELDISANKGKEKMHQAEKPIALYEYLIQQLTEENEICLDQFSGSMNLAMAAINTNRFGIAYEYAKEFVKKAVERFGAIELFDPEKYAKSMESEETAEIVEEEPAVETFHASFIPAEATKFQMNYLEKVARIKPELMTFEQRQFIREQLTLDTKDADTINQIFQQVNEKGYASYKRLSYDIGLEDYAILQNLYVEIEDFYKQMYPDEFTRGYYENYKIELESLAEFMVTKKLGSTFSDMKSEYVIKKYFDYVKAQNQTNIARTVNIISSFANTTVAA